MTGLNKNLVSKTKQSVKKRKLGGFNDDDRNKISLLEKSILRSFSKEMGEPAWLTDLRIHALEVAEDTSIAQCQIKQKLINGISLNLKNIL